jgi:hypothetical protein
MSGEDQQQQQQSKALSEMFDLSESICKQVLDEYKGNVNQAIDHLLTIKNLGKSLLPNRPPVSPKIQVLKCLLSFLFVFRIQEISVE